MKIFASLFAALMLLTSCGESVPTNYTDGKVVNCNSVKHVDGSEIELLCLGDGSVIDVEEGSEVEVIARSGIEMNSRQSAIAARQAAVRSLGNLSLLNLSVNRQVQNHPFKEKRDLFIANTNLRLNITLIPRTTWDEASIADRGKQLTDVAVKLWPGPRP